MAFKNKHSKQLKFFVIFNLAQVVYYTKNF